MTSRDLKRFALLAELGDSERESVGELLEELHLERGTVLFEEGDPGEGLLLVAEGGVRVESSRDAQPTTLDAGASLGAFSLVVDGRREARAETTSRARILRLRTSDYRHLRESDPRTACCLLEAILRETARLSREAFEDASDARGVPPSDVDPVHADD